MYRLTDQVRDLALGYADVHVQQKRPRALCEFDGQKWSPVELVDASQLNQIQPVLRQLSISPEKDSAYSSAAGSSVGHRSPEIRTPSIRSNKSSPSTDVSEATMHVATKFRRSSAFQIPELEVDSYRPSGAGIDEGKEHEEEEEDEAEREAERRQQQQQENHKSTGDTTLRDRADIRDPGDETEDVLRDMIVQQKSTATDGNGRRPSILASPAYQRNLINFADLAVSEVDLSEEELDCDLDLARRHIISAFPKQFQAEARSREPLTSFAVYSRAEEYVEMLHVVLVLETRTVFWRLVGPSDGPLDRVTRLPYCWEADLDLPPLSLDEPRVTDEVECVIMGRPVHSTVPCDDHNDECRKCKGLASQDDCFACEGSGVFKKKPCVMCSGQGQYYCTVCKNAGHVACKTCGSTDGPRPVLRQAFLTVTRETVVSPTMEVEGDNKATLITTAKALARQTVEAEQFAEGTLPVAACGVVIRQRGHIICATDLESGARGLFEVIPEVDRVEFKGQLAPISQRTTTTSRPASIRSNASGRSNASSSSKIGSWFKKAKAGGGDDGDADDAASIRSTASSRMKNIFRRS